MDQRITPIIFLSFLLNCEAAGEPGVRHDFADDTTGSEVEWPSDSTTLPPGVTDTATGPDSVATPSDIEPTVITVTTLPSAESGSESDGTGDPTLGTPHACGGEVPEVCLEDITDASHCTDGSTCEKYACGQRAFADGRLAMMRCLERECGVEPAYDLKCVEKWASLQEACLIDHCGLTGSPCTYMSLWGWQAECRR